MVALLGGIVRLNGWQRLGMIGSILLALVVAYRVDADQRLVASGNAYLDSQACIASKPTPKPNDYTAAFECSEKYAAAYNHALSQRWAKDATAAGVTILATWLIAYMFIGLFRWVRRGFFNA